jgi:hypothetical protein
MDNGREQRGLMIAATTRLARNGDTWTVPSQTTGGRKYTVEFEGETATCTCPDFEDRHERCKHVYAVEFTIQRERNADGSTTETRTMRVTYQQNWPAFNTAQTTEKAMVERLLKALCEGVMQPEQKRGRPRLPLADVIFAATMKVYTTMSGRRASTDIHECEEKGHIESAPHYNSIFNYLGDARLTPVLRKMIEESASPLKAVETDFAVDSSGFSTCTFVRWFDEKHGKKRTGRTWRKAHVIAQTNEILCKVLCHNLSVLVHSIYELGIAPTFWN